MITPFIRQDLNISTGPVKEDGSASWLLYDTLRNKYFSLNRNAIFLLRNWVGGEDINKFIDKTRRLNLGISGEEVKEFIKFYLENGAQFISEVGYVALADSVYQENLKVLSNLTE